MEKNVSNLAAAIVNDRRYPSLKTEIYENLVKSDHASVVAVFKALQDYALDAEDNSFHEGEKKIQTITEKYTPDFDPDLDDRLTEEELEQRK